MSRKPNSFRKTLLAATAVALLASGVALADDTSTGRFGGDGYAYFNQPLRSSAATTAVWRQDHPNGLSQRELQAASSSSLAASASQLDKASPLLGGASGDASWRQTHPNGLTNRELQAAGASSLAVWQLPEEANVENAHSNVAQTKQRR